MNKIIPKSLRSFLRKKRRKLKPLTVHTEAIYWDKVWEKIREKVREKKIYTWYLMAPVNYEYFKSTFGYRGTKKEMS